MKVAALASGSSGNCFYIEHNATAVLIDAGISALKIKEKLSLLKCNPAHIKGIFITHEHIDHVRGADVFSRQFSIPIFATRETMTHAFLCRERSLLKMIKNTSSVGIGSLIVKAFPKSHTAADPVSYVVKGTKKVTVITDIGHLCKRVTAQVSGSDFLFLESNHDLTMLEKGPYPHFLKSWIKSDSGHLSNKQAGLGILEYASSKLKHIVLSHLSEINNTPQQALATVHALLMERKDLSAAISVSLQEHPTPLFQV